MTAESLRNQTFHDLATLGFRPARWLPLPDLDRSLRPAHQVAARLMALDALFTWVAFPKATVDSQRIVDYVDRNQLRDWLTEDEAAILDLSRRKAHATHGDNIGWKLENMWPLAWALGFDPEPTLEAAQIDDEVIRSLLHDVLPGLSTTIDDLLARADPRPPSAVIALEDRFYCAHNAVRSAQLGRDTVPPGFHPVIHGGAVHERRHALTWCLAPDVPWDETDLST